MMHKSRLINKREYLGFKRYFFGGSVKGCKNNPLLMINGELKK
jgi:hypothetical protein